MTSTRDALIDAAADLLTTGGPAAVTLREVGRRAGVSHNAPYKHFADKEELLAAVAARDLDRRAAATRRAARNRPPAEALRAILSCSVSPTARGTTARPISGRRRRPRGRSSSMSSSPPSTTVRCRPAIRSASPPCCWRWSTGPPISRCRATLPDAARATPTPPTSSTTSSLTSAPADARQGNSAAR
jgi:AcrR family transcriptional regulator